MNVCHALLGDSLSCLWLVCVLSHRMFVTTHTHTLQTQLMRDTNSLCFSFHPSRGSTPLSSSLSSFVPFFLVQVFFFFLLCSNEENWDAWMAAILGSGLQRRQSWKTCRHLTPLCLLNHKKAIFGQRQSAFAASINFMGSDQAIKRPLICTFWLWLVLGRLPGFM